LVRIYELLVTVKYIRQKFRHSPLNATMEMVKDKFSRFNEEGQISKGVILAHPYGGTATIEHVQEYIVEYLISFFLIIVTVQCKDAFYLIIKSFVPKTMGFNILCEATCVFRCVLTMGRHGK
jgi:hypothetical protein